MHVVNTSPLNTPYSQPDRLKYPSVLLYPLAFFKAVACFRVAHAVLPMTEMAAWAKSGVLISHLN